MHTADALYGPLFDQAQPTATPTHAAGEPERVIRTVPLTNGLRDNPLLFLFALVAAAVLLLRFSVRGSFDLSG